MPTCTVKQVSGQLQRQNLKRQKPLLLGWARAVFNKRLPWWRQTVFAFLGLLLLTSPAIVNAQTLRARISVTSVTPGRIRVSAELPSATSALSFRNVYGGVLGLGERIESVEATTANGETIPVRKLTSGEYQAAEKFTQFSYDLHLIEPSRSAQMSHVSWLNRNYGLLMLADLLPQPTKDTVSFAEAEIQITVPTGWTVASNVQNQGNTKYLADNPDWGVFMVGPFVREKSQQIGGTNFSIITSGKWPFSDDDAIKIARKIIEEYSKLTGFELKRNAHLMLIPYPGDAGPERWSAETRGNEVVLLLGSNAHAKRVLSQLAIVLSHELFHLWVPNSLQLEGDYDWFFEGFTLYQALRMDLRLRLISFDDYLSTIARVYDSYLSSLERDRLSLIEASERRWTTSSSLVYDQGMLVAFIYDLLLRNRTACMASLDTVYGELFRRQSARHGNANDTIINLLNEPEGLNSFGQDYVKSAGRINLESIVAPYGFQVKRGTSGTRLSIEPELNKGQRNLLGCLGYRK
jgi:predicted metalloprotease with PDZ domain